ncbi:MAG: orotidine-5'-phosphate decarboxylase [Actinomycetota bacterium]
MSAPGVIAALDHTELAAAERAARELEGLVDAFKVGATLFAAHGPEALQAVGAHGPVFCDLKLHDIPEQVGSAVGALSAQGVWMLTVHASGGTAMVAAAAAAAAAVPEPPLVAAVTVLTSLDAGDLDAVGQGRDPLAQVVRLARLATGAGARALVCSAEEVGRLRTLLGPDVVLVVPGIRPAGSDHGDQARVSSPASAARAGASFLVVGRPITRAPDPRAAAEQIRAEVTGR